MIKKIVKYTLLFCVALVLLLVGGSFVAGIYMGSDIDTFAQGQSRAHRDAEGVWEIKAPDREALWHTFGYLQAHDRYFQIELTRHAALGRLAELMGADAVTRDRLSRTMAGIAYSEFATKAADSPLRRSAEKFSEGINAWRKTKSSTNPVEFKALGLSIADLPAWEPWHVYAISY